LREAFRSEQPVLIVGLVTAPDDADELLSVEEKQRLSDLRDTDANRRDLNAEVRDRYAEVRDHNAEVRDDKLSGEPDPRGSRRRAAKDRAAAADDREASGDDRQHARGDREVSRWDRSVARQREEQLLQALRDTDDLAESTLLIGQAQGMLMEALHADPLEALIELGDRASQDHLDLQEAARRLIAESPGTIAAADQRPPGTT
jgi:hypothetical protein